MKKTIDLLLAAVFFLFAGFQYNDPDAFQWILIYGLVGFVPLLALFRRYPRPLMLIAALACMLELVLVFPGFIDYLMHGQGASIIDRMQPDKLYIEETRETLGLLMALGCVGYYFFRARKKAGAKGGE